MRQHSETESSTGSRCWVSWPWQPATLLGHPAGQWELDLGVVHLCDEGTAALPGSHYLAPDYLDSVGPGPVPGPHVPVALGDGPVHSEVPVLTVHVVGAGPRVVPQPDTEVLDDQRLLLSDFLHRHDFSSGLLELPQLPQEIPEPGFGDNLIRCKDPHPVEGSHWLSLSGELAANDPVFLQGSLRLHPVFSCRSESSNKSL